MKAAPEDMSQSEPDGLRTVPSAEISGVIDANRQGRPLVLSNKRVETDVSDEATCVDDPGAILFLNEVNGSFCMATGEGDRRVESAAISLDDLLVLPERKADLDVFKCRSAKNK